MNEFKKLNLLLLNINYLNLLYRAPITDIIINVVNPKIIGCEKGFKKGIASRIKYEIMVETVRRDKITTKLNFIFLFFISSSITNPLYKELGLISIRG